MILSGLIDFHWEPNTTRYKLVMPELRVTSQMISVKNMSLSIHFRKIVKMFVNFHYFKIEMTNSEIKIKGY